MLAQGVALGAPPWIGVVICVTWVAYAAVRKHATVPAATGLLVESAVLIPVAVGLLFWVSQKSGLSFDDSVSNAFLLSLAGPATAGPLVLFAIAVRRVSFSTLGVLQYLAPCMQFLLAVIFGEPLGMLRVTASC